MCAATQNAPQILREHPNHPRTCVTLADYYRRKGNVGLANFYKLSAGQDANAKD